MSLNNNPAAPSGELPARGFLPGLQLSTEIPDEAQALIIPVTNDGGELEIPARGVISEETVKAVFSALRAVGATGAAEEVTVIPAPENFSAQILIAVGLGDAADIDSESIRRAAGAAARAAQNVATSQATADDGAEAFVVASSLAEFGLAPTVEGTLLGGYRYLGIRSARNDDDNDATGKPAVRFHVVSSAEDASDEFAIASVTAEATAFARDLVNTPSNELYPETYAAVLKKEATDAGLEVEILDEVELARQGFGGILAVGRGSHRPPRLVRLSWSPENAKDSVALVGKGITFDSGGISLKPGRGMWDMIQDMGGSAAAAAATIAAARLELPIQVTATLPLAENMPSGSATRPGDVITHYGGITSEILNTDAEGRMVLADAMARACEDNPSYLIDTATLTGAQMVALGDRTAGVMGTEEFRDTIAEIGRRVGENAWAMPLLEEHEEDVKSPIADIRNINAKREGGMEYAATYLSRFVGEGIHWAHIDVAGPAWNDGAPWGYNYKRATGVPTRTIIAALRDIATK